MKRFFVHTFGCKVNQYETELLRSQIESGGGKSVGDMTEADLCVVNSCSVTAKADEECRQFVRRILRSNPRARVVVTGCYASHSPAALQKISPRVEVYSNKQKDLLPSCLGFEVSPETFGLSRYGTRSRAFVKIQDGCKAPCTYCIIPTVRSHYWSKPVADVVKEVGSLVAAGHGEVVLTGIRLGLYHGTSSGGGGGLVALLRKLVALPGKFRIRLSSLEVSEVGDELIDLIASTPRICRHLHVPIQSADDGVLKAMGRWYTFADYKERLSAIKRSLPDCGLTTDVMVGFPAESEEAFERTEQRIGELGVSGLHVFPFSSRPGTKASSLHPLSRPVVVSRVRRLVRLGETLKDRFQEKFKGTSREVLVEPSGEGWTDNYIRANVPLGSVNGTLVSVIL